MDASGVNLDLSLCVLGLSGHAALSVLGVPHC